MCSPRHVCTYIKKMNTKLAKFKRSLVLCSLQRRRCQENTLVDLTGARNQTHRPGELEGDQNLASLVDFIRVTRAPKRKHISTENLRRSSSERAGAGGGDLHLVLLQADLEVSVALVSSAAQVLGAPGAVAALPVRQLAVYILHGDQLQLEIAGRLGHLETTF